MGEGVSPHPRQFSLYLADWQQQHRALPCTLRASGHILQHLRRVPHLPLGPVRPALSLGITSGVG